MNFQRLLMVLFVLVNFSGFSQVMVDTSYRFPLHVSLFSGSKKPVVLIDGNHQNLHRFETGFAPFARLLKQAGCEVHALPAATEQLAIPAETNVLVIANPLHPSNAGRWINPVKSAFTRKEIAVIKKWVEDGGSLLLIADHMPFAGAAQELAAAFGVSYINGFTGISNQWPPDEFDIPKVATYHPYFHVNTVATFTGSALQLPANAVNLLPFTATDSVYVSDTAWVFDHAEAIPLEGYSQGGILQYGKGKVAFFGEAAMFTAQLANGDPIGFNDPAAPENAHFILDVVLQLCQKSEEEELELRRNCEKQQIMEVYFKMDTLFARNKMEAIADCYAEDGKILGNRSKIEGRENIQVYWGNLRDKGVHWNHTILELQVAETMAYQSGVSELEYLTGNGDETLISKVNYTLVWKKSPEGEWKIYIDHYTPVAN